MTIEKIETSPFEIIDNCIRQRKARDGESEGGWRLDLVVKNTGNKPRSKIEVSLRYFDKDKMFVGLDQQSLWRDDYIKQNETKDLTFYIEPPREVERVELRIKSKSSISGWVEDPPIWLIVLFVFVVVGITSVVHQLIQ